MATSSAHPPYPSRPYTGLGRTGGGANTFAQTPYAQPQQQQQNFSGAPAPTQQQREAQRLERERLERAERERREAEDRGVLEALSEEQREEINEAVWTIHKKLELRVMLTEGFGSSRYST